MVAVHEWHGNGAYSFAAERHEVHFLDDSVTDEQEHGFLVFQDGPVAEHGINGTTNEQVLQAVIERLQALNTPPFNCRENSLAITHLEEALHWLYSRTLARSQRGVEGTSTP